MLKLQEDPIPSSDTKVVLAFDYSLHISLKEEAEPSFEASASTTLARNIVNLSNDRRIP